MKVHVPILSIPFGILRPWSCWEQVPRINSFQFLLGFYRVTWQVVVPHKMVNFQFLLGFYPSASQRPASPGHLSIPFGILPETDWEGYALGGLYFQFLLGFYAGAWAAWRAGRSVLSIPFGILRAGAAPLQHTLRYFQFLLGFYI